MNRTWGTAALLLLATSVCFADVSESTQSTFKEVCRMVGKTWKGKLGKMDVTMKYHLSADGKTMLGEGTVVSGTNVVLRTQSFIGIDEANDRVYYLDRHNDTVVYFGTVSRDKSELVFDFTGLIGEKGHWISRMTFPSADAYENRMSVVDAAGKVGAPMMHLELKRVDG